MTHGFVVRIPLADAPDVPERAARLAAQGWRMSEPVQGWVVACRGEGEIAVSGDRVVCGMAFCDDRQGLLEQFGDPASEERSDLDLLARWYAEQGDAKTDVPSGSYAFVLLNTDGSGIAGLRDPFGIYPFFHILHDGALTCGSDIRACLHLSGLPISPDTVRIADFVRGEDIDPTLTAFDGLSRLPAGHRLMMKNGAVQVSRYWALDAPVEPVNARSAAVELRQALRDATAARMPAGPRTGAMLSGGLDSSTLTGLAAEVSKERSADRLATLSFVYGADKAHDESRYIATANETFETIPHDIRVEAAPDLGELRSLIDEQMELFLAPGLQKSCLIYFVAHELGLDVLLDGHGGDEVISHGYSRLAELAANWRLLQLFHEGRGAAAVHGVPFWGLYTGHLVRYGGLRPRNPLRRILARVARRQMATSRLTQHPDPGIDLIAHDVRSRVDATARYADEPVSDGVTDPSRIEQDAHLKSLTSPTLIQSFEVLHRSAIAAGIMPRYPFLDQRVVSLCLGLGADRKLRNGQTRWILREAMRGLLPEAIRQRRDKAEFGSEVAESVTAYFENRDLKMCADLARFVDLEHAETLRQSVLSGDRQDAVAIRALWRLAVLEQWLDVFADWQAAQAKGVLI